LRNFRHPGRNDRVLQQEVTKHIHSVTTTAMASLAA
jgi:hypothetical protein